jgi:hypothetical protein
VLITKMMEIGNEILCRYSYVVLSASRVFSYVYELRLGWILEKA